MKVIVIHVRLALRATELLISCEQQNLMMLGKLHQSRYDLVSQAQKQENNKKVTTQTLSCPTIKNAVVAYDLKRFETVHLF